MSTAKQKLINQTLRINRHKRPKWSFTGHITHSICPHSQHAPERQRKRKKSCVIETNGGQIAHCIMTRGKTISRMSQHYSASQTQVFLNQHCYLLHRSMDFIILPTTHCHMSWQNHQHFLIVQPTKKCVCVCVCQKDNDSSIVFCDYAIGQKVPIIIFFILDHSYCRTAGAIECNNDLATGKR